MNRKSVDFTDHLCQRFPVTLFQTSFFTEIAALRYRFILTMTTLLIFNLTDHQHKDHHGNIKEPTDHRRGADGVGKVDPGTFSRPSIRI